MSLTHLRHAKFAPHLLIVVAAALVWGHSVKFEFLWDDRPFIIENQSIRSLKNAKEILLTAEASAPTSFKIYRPLRTLHYAVLRWIGGKPDPQPWLFHLANLVWHVLASILVFSVCRRLFRRITERREAFWGALLVALGFAVHPVLSEVVCWAKGLDDIMATVFVLASARGLLRWKGDKASYWIALLWFALAVYSKESAVPFVAIAFILLLKFHRRPLRQSVSLSVPFLAVALIHVVHRHILLGQSHQVAPLSGSYSQTLIDTLPVTCKYLRLLFGIPPFFALYTFLPIGNSILSVPVLSGIAVILGTGGLIAYCWKKPRLQLVAFGLIWITVFLLPVSNLLPMMQFMAERFLYLPMVGFLIALGSVLLVLPRPRFLPLLCCCVIVVWGCIAWDRSWIWRDQLTLYVQTSLQGPKIPQMEQFAVYAILKQPKMEATYVTNAQGEVHWANASAILHTLEEARKMYPNEDVLLSELGVAYTRLRHTNEALKAFHDAAAVAPTNPNNVLNLAYSYSETGQSAEAKKLLPELRHLIGGNAPMLERTAALCEQLGDLQSALELLQAAARCDKNIAGTLQTRIAALQQKLCSPLGRDSVEP